MALATVQRVPAGVDVVTKGTAAIERRKLFLLQRTRTARTVGAPPPPPFLY